MVLTAAQIRAELEAFSPREITQNSDTHYFCPQTESVREFANWLKFRNRVLYPPVKPRQIQQSDCDDIATIALAEAVRSLSLSAVKANAGAAYFRADVHIAAAETLFREPYVGPVNHAVLFVRSAQNEWLLLEPFLGEFTSLSGLLRDGVIGPIWSVRL